MPEEVKWHLHAAVPITIVLFLLGQTVTVGWMMITDHFRIDILERQRIERNAYEDGRQAQQDQRLANLEQALSKLAIIEDRQNSVLKRLDNNALKLDTLIDHLMKK